MRASVNRYGRVKRLYFTDYAEYIPLFTPVLNRNL